MGWWTASFAPPGSRSLDRRYFGRRRSPGAVLAGFLAMFSLGVSAWAVCWVLGSHDEIWQMPSLSGISSHPTVFRSLSTEIETLGFVSFLVFPGGHLLAILGPAAIRRWSYLWRGTRDRLRWRLPLATTLGAAADGQWVRVRGQVTRGAGFASAGGRAGAVIASCLGSVGDIADRRGRTRYLWELHGANFRIALPRGEEVAVSVENATLLDRPARFPASLLSRRPFSPRAFEPDESDRGGAQGAFIACVYHEQSIAAGDWIEVVGLLSHGVDPAADAGPRGTRLQPQLGSTPTRRLLIRAVDDVGTAVAGS